MKTFDNIILIGRPAAGKSELIDFLKKISDARRAEQFHIGKFVEMDDFPWLWEKFLEDNMWEEAGFSRIYSHRDGDNYGLNPDSGKLLDLMFVKFNKEYREKYENNPDFFNDGTLFIEFARGCDYGFNHSFPRLSPGILKKAAILYIDVSYEEATRKNDARYREKLKSSILAHKATDLAVESFFKENDWKDITDGKESGRIEINGIKVPFVTMNNEPELTEEAPLAERYEAVLTPLWELYNS